MAEHEEQEEQNQLPSNDASSQPEENTNAIAESSSEHDENVVSGEDVSGTNEVEESEVVSEPTEEAEEPSKLEPATAEAETEPDTAENTAEEASTLEESTASVEDDPDTVGHADALEAGIEEEGEEAEDSEETEDGEEEELDFSTYSQVDLVTFLDKVSKDDKPLKWVKSVNQAKERYNELFEIKRKKALADFLEIEGNTEIDFRYPLEMVDRNWRELFRNYSIKKKSAREALVKEREVNLRKKLQIIEDLKGLTENATDKDSFNKLKELQENWRNIGMVPAGDSNNLYKNYRYLVDKFFDQRSLIREFQDYDRKKNLEAKQEVVEGIKQLAEKENLAEMMAEVKKLQESWKDIGPVPKENLDELMTAYREANELITTKKEGFIEVLEVKRNENLRTKEALIEKIYELTDDEVEKPWVKKNKELAALIEAWKLVGAVPRSESERIRTEFRDAVKVFNKLKNTFFKEQKREKLGNLDLKVEACEKVEKLLEKEGLHNYRNEVIKIQKYWKTIGPIPRKQSDEIWKRFRAACDAFFNKLKEADASKNAEQVENLKKKEELCEKVEALANEESADLEAIKALEEEWKNIGFVPFSAKKEIQKRFENGVKAALGKSVQLGDVAPELEDFKESVKGWLSKPNSGFVLEKERANLKKKMQKQRDELSTLETNIQFFSNSKNAEKLIGDIHKQIEAIKQDIELSKKKDRLIAKSFQFTRS